MKINKYNISSQYVINIILPILHHLGRSLLAYLRSILSQLSYYIIFFTVCIYSPTRKSRGEPRLSYVWELFQLFFWYKCRERHDWPSQLNTQLKRLWNHSLKKIQIQPWTGFEPVTSVIPVQCSTKWTIKPTGSCSLFILNLKYIVVTLCRWVFPMLRMFSLPECFIIKSIWTF